MSARPHDAALDALLADYAPPSMSGGFAARVAAAAVALPQETPTPASRPWRDRRGAWLRRPFLIGGAALGLAFSGAVAATYAGVELPPKIQSVLAELPFVQVKAEPDPPKAPSRPRASPARPDAPAAMAPVAAQRPERPLRAFWRELSPYERRRLRNAPPARRLNVARQIVETRRSAGLPTPGAEQIERAAERRREIRQVRRAERRAMRRERIKASARRSIDPPIGGREAMEGLAPGFDRVADPLDARQERREAVRVERLERRRAAREERLRRLRARPEQSQPDPPLEPR